MDNREKHIDWRLVAGDALVILATVLIGLKYHEASMSFLTRTAYNFFAWFLAWSVAGFALRIFEFSVENWLKLGSRLTWAMLLAAPLATLLRAVWLGQAGIPVFALIMGLVTLVSLLIWRLIFGALTSKANSYD